LHRRISAHLADTAQAAIAPSRLYKATAPSTMQYSPWRRAGCCRDQMVVELRISRCAEVGTRHDELRFLHECAAKSMASASLAPSKIRRPNTPSKRLDALLQCNTTIAAVCLVEHDGCETVEFSYSCGRLHGVLCSVADNAMIPRPRLCTQHLPTSASNRDRFQSDLVLPDLFQTSTCRQSRDVSARTSNRVQTRRSQSQFPTLDLDSRG
jgi:hypothetical protein